MKKLPKFCPEFVTKRFFPDTSPEDINCGECFIWAYYAFLLFEGVEIYDVDIHAFVKYKGKFYDSERPKGVKDWRDLPATNFGKEMSYGGGKLFVRKRTQDSFKRSFWRECLELFETSWKKIETKAQKVLP